MLKGPRFAKASYAMFAVAVMMAALKLGGFLDAEPLFLKTVSADQVAKTSEPELRRQTEEREASDPHRRLKILRLVRSSVRSSEA